MEVGKDSSSDGDGGGEDGGACEEMDGNAYMIAFVQSMFGA